MLQADAEAMLGTSRASAHGGFGGAGDRLAWTLDVPSIGDYVDEVDGRVKASGTLGGTWAVPEAVIAAELQELELPHGYRIAGATASISGSLARHEGRFTARTEAGEVQVRLRGGLTAPKSWAGEILSLANYFCRSARLRIDHYFAGASDNVDRSGYQLTQELLAGKHESLRDGIV